MRKKISVLMISGMLMFLSVQIAKCQFVIKAEFRPRTEFRDGYKTLLTSEQNPAFVTTQRSRLALNYERDNVEVCLSIQDIRVWGDEPYKTDISVVNVYQAYAGYRFNENILMRIGRQELVYDNNRLLGPRNWNNVGASHNVGRFMFEKNKLKIHSAIGYNNDKEKNYESNYSLDYYKYLAFIWMNTSFNNISLSLVNIADGHQQENSDTKINNRMTSGIYTKLITENKSFGCEAAFYYQYGQAPDGLDLNAYYFSVSPFFKPTDNLKVILATEYFSGDDNVTVNNESNTFDKLYGNGHGLYGYMDYFTEIPGHTKYGGLMDTYMTLVYNVGEKVTTEFTAHNFSLTNNVLDTITNPALVQAADKQLGVEIDFMLKYKFHKEVEFRAGYSTMLATDSMQILKGGDADKYQQWAWLMLVFKPTLFKHEF